jgi:transposase InsO family protein
VGDAAVCRRQFDAKLTAAVIRVVEWPQNFGPGCSYPRVNGIDVPHEHRSLKEEEVWTSEYRSFTEARENSGRYLEEYNHDRPHFGIGNRIPNEAFLSFAVLTKNEALTV